MADHVTLAHDNTASGDWSSFRRAESALSELQRRMKELQGADREEAIIEAFARSIEVARHPIRDDEWAGKLAAAELDIKEAQSHTQPMNDITREEFNARMETIEVKMDARVETVSAKIEGFLAVQAERDKRLDESIANIRGDISRLGSLKLNIWGAMLTAVGVGIAIAALSVTFYQTGKADKPESPPAAITAPAK